MGKESSRSDPNQHHPPTPYSITSRRMAARVAVEQASAEVSSLKRRVEAARMRAREAADQGDVESFADITDEWKQTGSQLKEHKDLLGRAVSALYMELEQHPVRQSEAVEALGWTFFSPTDVAPG